MKTFAPWLCAFTVLAGCSRSTETNPAPAVAGNPQAAASAPAPQGYVQVPDDLLARLVRPDSPVLGPPNAPVMLVEFLDPACEACRAFAPVISQVQFLYPKEVRVVLRFADFHPGSEEAIRILLAAQRQGKLESVLAALFEDQEQWASHAAPNIDAAWKIAGRAGLDVPRARKDASSAQVSQRLDQEAEDIMALQVTGTPTFYVNDKLLTDFGPAPLMKLVGSEVKAAAPAAAAPR
ncbi:MAG TPA: thioredoxin domain-containing protein [Steroidobacteraceae bacterium]